MLWYRGMMMKDELCYHYHAVEPRLEHGFFLKAYLCIKQNFINIEPSFAFVIFLQNFEMHCNNTPSVVNNFLPLE